MQHPDKGYRRIRDDLEHDFGMDVNDKRVLPSKEDQVGH